MKDDLKDIRLSWKMFQTARHHMKAGHHLNLAINAIRYIVSPRAKIYAKQLVDCLQSVTTSSSNTSIFISFSISPSPARHYINQQNPASNLSDSRIAQPRFQKHLPAISTACIDLEVQTMQYLHPWRTSSNCHKLSNLNRIHDLHLKEIDTTCHSRPPRAWRLPKNHSTPHIHFQKHRRLISQNTPKDNSWFKQHALQSQSVLFFPHNTCTH
jgi:hypothetical protein